MDYRVLSPVEITNIIEITDPVKLCGLDVSKDNILFYVTNGVQFTKLIAKCGKQILDKPSATGEYYINEVIKNRLLPAVEIGDESLINQWSTFYEILVNDYGHVPLLRTTGDKKETSMHLLLQNKNKHIRLEELYKLSVGKIPKKQAATMVDRNGINIFGCVVEPTTPKSRPSTPLSAVNESRPSTALSAVNRTGSSTILSAVNRTGSSTALSAVNRTGSSTALSAANESRPSTGLPILPPLSESMKMSITIDSESSSEPPTPLGSSTVSTTTSDINPFTGKQTPSACITILKGYETHFFNPNFTSYLKTIKK